ncbi:MAG: IS1595 family transposase [Proteobacteria bacterium]|nr:IS1595 family transposase [Pseudomonadota bacterium]
MTAAVADRPELFPLRKRTGTAAFHMSKEAVDFGYEDLDKLTQKEAVTFMAEARWGSTKEMPCTHCGTFDAHYWNIKELRWKCTCCGKRFSVTSGTVFADRKLSLIKILKIIFSWANGASGKPALQLRRDWNVAYSTVFTLVHKLREGLLRGFNVGVLCGVQEVDGMDVNGRRYREKRNKPQSGSSSAKPRVPEHLLKPKVDPETGEIVGPPKPPKFGKTAKQPADRRLLLVMRQRGKSQGRGASATRIAIALSECGKTVTALATRYASAESKMMSDEDPSYATFSKLFAEHKTINHSKQYALPDGTNNNQAESFNWRMRRAVEGIYLNPSNKYLKDYGAEQAWREDTRRMSTGQKLKNLLRVAMGVGMSLWWRGFTHGAHRDEELLIEGPRPASGRGPKKGAKPKPPR